jgi:hypothetical protein
MEAAMNGIALLVFLVLSPIALAVASVLWGADSRDGPDSPEWERRREWRGFH